MVVIKHRYIPGRNRGGNVVSIGKALAHVKYIQQRPGPDKERGGRDLFNEQEDRLDSKEMKKTIKELGDSRVVVHKLTLAPEINPQDKKAFTREVMQKLGQDMGRDLRWFGVEHNNTDHHHIHVVVLGKDRNGTEVKIGLNHIEKAKEHGDRYLERWHPRELERSRKDRADREKERIAERTRERELAKEERIREGLELPWMHKKIIREQLEPYKEWQEKQDQKEKGRELGDDKAERPYHQDTLEAAGKEWSKVNNLKELRELNQYLWDNIDERIPKEDYRRLSGWIKDKERDQEREPEAKPAKDKDRHSPIEYEGKKYSRGDSYEKLTGFSRELRENNERLPFDDYQKLRGWIENKDRERWSGALEKQIEATNKKFERSKTAADLKAQEGGRVIDPMQEALMRNPIVGLFMTEAAIASEIVRSITLDDRNRDYTKEQRDGLEETKKNLDEREISRKVEGVRMPWDIAKAQEERDREQREKVEKAIEENKKRKDKEREKEEERKREKDRSPFERDSWGRW
jgi:type IV secretory pathway VirD2 relaxase